MQRDSGLKRFLFNCGTRDGVASVGLVVLRVAVGLMMLLGHGLPKWRNYAALRIEWHVPDFFPLYYLSPQLSLLATLGAEVLAAGLLVLGLMTRPAAFVLGFVMVVAAFDVNGALPWVSATGGASKELALLYLIPMLVLLLTGAGAWSLDASLYREPKRRHW
ncbi:MAG: DoxX family protein [Akkermansiaceae bacterium]|nr:DoxX family protein [Akkermansiaceae bacterium]